MTYLEETAQNNHCVYNGREEILHGVRYLRCSHPIHDGREVYIPKHKCGERYWCKEDIQHEAKVS